MVEAYTGSVLPAHHRLRATEIVYPIKTTSTLLLCASSKNTRVALYEGYFRKMSEKATLSG